MDLFVPGPCGPLEAKLWEPLKGAAVKVAAVFCHPHPLYGGTMDNKVVFRAAKGLAEAGIATMRFNFRGVRRSAGEHHGQGGEADDLGACLDWMQARHPSAQLWAGGFSFGSRTAVQRALVDERIRRLVLVALPVKAFQVAYFAEVRQPGIVVMADRDEFGTLAELRRQFPTLPPGFEAVEIANSGHFFDETGLELQACVREYALRHLQELP